MSDRAEELAREALTCRMRCEHEEWNSPSVRNPSDEIAHWAECPAYNRPAVARAIRTAVEEARDEWCGRLRGTTHWSDCWKSHHGCALARIAKLEAALVQIERHAHMNRLWGGMSWEYHSAPGFRVKTIANLARGALDAEEAR